MVFFGIERLVIRIRTCLVIWQHVEWIIVIVEFLVFFQQFVVLFQRLFFQRFLIRT